MPGRSTLRSECGYVWLSKANVKITCASEPMSGVSRHPPRSCPLGKIQYCARTLSLWRPIVDGKQAILLVARGDQEQSSGNGFTRHRTPQTTACKYRTVPAMHSQLMTNRRLISWCQPTYRPTTCNTWMENLKNSTLSLWRPVD